MKQTVKNIISKLDLIPHPEGGFYRETYRSEEEIETDCLSKKYTGSRNYSTCIYFMLTSDNFSAFHKIKQDEIWHFYDGSPILLHMIAPNGDYSFQKIGKALEEGQVPQYVVPGGTWFAAEVDETDSFTLIGCTVSPGFNFEDFELKPGTELKKMFPRHEVLINKLTHD